MRHKNLTALSGVIIALAFAQAPAQALEILGNRVGVNVNIGGHKGGGSHLNANIGNTRATVHAGVRATAHGIGARAIARVGVGTLSRQTLSLSARVNIDLGGSKKGIRAKVDINGDGVIDTRDTALLRLDVNSDGVLNLLDDCNKDGVLSDIDIRLYLNIGRVGLPVGEIAVGELPIGKIGDVPIGEIGVGEIPIDDIDIDVLPLPIVIGELPDPDEVPAPGPGPDPRPDPGIDPTDISDTMRTLNDNDVAALKIKCVDVLANPSAFSTNTVSVCKALAAL